MAHLLLFILLSQNSGQLKKNHTYAKTNSPHKLNIKKIGHRLKKNKNTLYIPTQAKSTKKQISNLSQLSSTHSSFKAPPLKKNKIVKKANIKKDAKNLLKKFKQQALPNKKIRKILSRQKTHRQINKLLNHSSFTILPPSADEQDKLNSHDKKFFIFFQRAYLSYVNSIISTFNAKSRRDPYLSQHLTNQTANLSANVIFNEDGEIERISFIKSSKSDKIYHLFEDIMKNIKSLPNPPFDLLDKDKKFKINYQLSFNQY